MDRPGRGETRRGLRLSIGSVMVFTLLVGVILAMYRFAAAAAWGDWWERGLVLHVAAIAAVVPLGSLLLHLLFTANGLDDPNRQVSAGVCFALGFVAAVFVAGSLFFWLMLKVVGAG